MQPSVCGGEAFLAVIHLIAERFALVPDMTVKNLAVAAVFTENKRSAVILRSSDGKNVAVDTSQVAALLIIPAACVVNNP